MRKFIFLFILLMGGIAFGQTLPQGTFYTSPMIPHAGGPMIGIQGPMVPGGGPMIPNTSGDGGLVSGPTVTLVNPNTGSTAGGNTVIISGTQFIGLVGAAAVKFGANNATSYMVLSATAISAVVPAHAAGTVDVVVTNPIGSSPTNPSDHYTYSSCSKSLNFAQACNSQYLPLIH